MELVLEDNDFEKVLKETDILRLREPYEAKEVLGQEASQKTILDAFPKALVRRFRDMIPEDYKITEIELKVTISGTPFGVGVGGDATVRFGPHKSD